MSDAAMETAFDHFHARRRDEVIVRIAGPRFREIPFLDGEIFMVFTVRDGRIQRIDDYRTREEAARAVETPV